MIINAYEAINDLIFMHVLIFMCIFLSFHEKFIIILKILKIWVKYDDLKINILITHLYLRLQMFLELNNQRNHFVNISVYFKRKHLKNKYIFLK